MKTRTLTCILILLLALIITACRSDEPVEEINEAQVPISTEAETTEDAYPAAYPITEAFTPIEEAAYPITEADLAWLQQTWRLATYTEDGVEQAPPVRMLTFNADGSYSIITESEQETGVWTTLLLAVESTLILNRDTGETQYYQIINLGENELNLRTLRGNVQIDEGYLPPDLCCGYRRP